MTRILELSRGVVLDATSNLVMAANPGGGIDAVDAELGIVIWHSAGADMPLAIHAGLLVAQVDVSDRGISSIAIIDIGSGTRVALRQVSLPDHVLAIVDQSLRDRFRVRAATVRNSTMILHWSHRHLPIRSTSDPENQPRSSSGVVEVDLDLSAYDSFSSSTETLLPKPLKPDTNSLEVPPEGSEAKQVSTETTGSDDVTHVAGQHLHTAGAVRLLVNERHAGETHSRAYRWSLNKTQRTYPATVFMILICVAVTAQAQTTYETTLNLQPPGSNFSGIDRVVYVWSTPETSGQVYIVQFQDGSQQWIIVEDLAWQSTVRLGRGVPISSPPQRRPADLRNRRRHFVADPENDLGIG